MKKIKYTPDAADKLRNLREMIAQQYGADKAKEIIRTITESIRGLADNEKKGSEVSKMFGIATDYRCLFVARNYVFYRIEDKYVRIINLYNEKEDFMWQLFGIETTSQETIDFWSHNVENCNS